jgi:class 3 adenylate cyclase/predicted ATPase
MDVSTWLRDLGLGNYIQAFQVHDIDAEVLPRLTADDLTALGIKSVGHRRRLLDAIATLHGGTASAHADPATVVVTRAAEAERRQLTVLFCDLVGSTELAAQLDPEDMGAIMSAYHCATAAVVERFDGHVAKYLGDGVLAYFGWPRAHEDDAERAVRAGLELVEAVARLEPHADVRLSVRVGIATGQVVVGDLVGAGATRDEAVVGDTPNLAARLQALAAPGSVVISQATRRLVGGLFELDDLGPQRVKGFAEPLIAWRVAGASLAEDRFEARQTAGLTPLVGREDEIALLLRRWRQASDGEGQVVLLPGEPGIGKSRLVREVRDRLAAERHVRLIHQCSPYHQTSPLRPVVEHLERAAGFARDDPPEARLNKLETLLARGTDNLDQAVPLIAALLGIAIGERYPALDVTPQRQKQLTLEALLDQLEGLAAEQPVLMVHEDLHWMDPTTQELLGLAIERIPRLPILLLVTFRPEFTPPWSGQPHVSSLPLTRLGRRDGALMVDRVVGEKSLPTEVITQILAKTDGVPLFVEQLTKTVLESGLLNDVGDRYELVGTLPPLAIPATLHDSLVARLDRLAPVKELAQIGAAIGRKFSHALLAAVAEASDAELLVALDRLVASGLVFRRGIPPEATYSFKHALVQDAAYGTLLKSRRQQLHARIAEALRERFPEIVETEPELMARHCTEAGLTEEAIHYLAKAGRQAVERSATAEAVGHLSKALALLGSRPAGPERDAAELDLLVALGPPLSATKGFTDPEVKKTYLRARTLCQGFSNTTNLVPVLVGLANIHLLRAEPRQARELSEECLKLAQHVNHPDVLIAADRMLGARSYFLGEFARARARLEQANALHELHQHRSDVSPYLASSSRVYCGSILARVLWTLGYPERALRTSDEALRLARQACYSDTLARALSLAAAFHLDRRDVQRTQRLAREAVALAAQHGFPYWRATGSLSWGWALVQRQKIKEGLARIQQSLAYFRAKGDVQTVPHALIILAKVSGQVGDPRQGLEALAEALIMQERINEHRREAENHRLKGELLLQLRGRHLDEAEACFDKALVVARRQDAKMWEVRAAMSLARLWRDQGRWAEANDLLAPVYGWFTEGFDTADLREAKALLDELA